MRVGLCSVVAGWRGSHFRYWTRGLIAPILDHFIIQSVAYFHGNKDSFGNSFHGETILPWVAV